MGSPPPRHQRVAPSRDRRACAGAVWSLACHGGSGVVTAWRVGMGERGGGKLPTLTVHVFDYPSARPSCLPVHPRACHERDRRPLFRSPRRLLYSLPAQSGMRSPHLCRFSGESCQPLRTRPHPPPFPFSTQPPSPTSTPLPSTPLKAAQRTSRTHAQGRAGATLCHPSFFCHVRRWSVPGKAHAHHLAHRQSASPPPPIRRRRGWRRCSRHL